MRKASTFMIKTEYLVPTGKKYWGEKKRFVVMAK